MTARHARKSVKSNGFSRPILITGGAGFIGSNLAERFLSRGDSVLLLDNLSRAGVERNARWLADRYGDRVRLVVGDTRDAPLVRQAVEACKAVFHFAAQVAVTTSLVEPLEDFAINVQGTLNVLEAMRALEAPPPLLYTSTNKVYGDLADLSLTEDTTRVTAAGEHARGVDERRSLEFHSPYGCSKGAADQYVLDYARSFGLPAAVFRMSCIYGPRQFGTEDQGWVAHFLIRALQGKPITLYGDGKQVRDLLFVHDLIDAMLLASDQMAEHSGQAFNIGGGPDNVMSLLELLALIGQLTGTPPRTQRAPQRVGDQRFYVSDTSKFSERTGWRARVGCEEGVKALYRWVCRESGMLAQDHRSAESRRASAVP